jgi:3-oxoacyl-[acyl-carrier protein] reductase
MPVTLSIDNRVALITGGSRGIGAACVRIFAEAGARVAFNYHRARDHAQKLVDEIGATRCAALQADLGGLSGSAHLVHQVVEAFGRLDILVVNHGIWPPDDAPVDCISDEQWSETLGTNLDSAFALTKYAVAQMKRQAPIPTDQQPGAAPAGHAKSAQAAGHIVYVASTAAQRGEAFHCDYAASKGALISMTKGLSTELAANRIYVNCVAPGWVATDMSAPALNDAETAEKVFRSIPLRRVATPEEVAAPVLFLCTRHAGFITGEIFNVNGGAVLVG